MSFIGNTAFDIKRTKMKENKKQKIREGLADLAAKAEQDHEVQMARSELYKLSKYAIKLHDLLKTVSEKEGLQAWQQSYITKAADYIDAVYHDLEYEKSIESEVNSGIDQAEEEIARESKYKKSLSKILEAKLKRSRK
jgi:ribosome assembly protein YihI (activator of Der GTPase)